MGKYGVVIVLSAIYVISCVNANPNEVSKFGILADAAKNLGIGGGHGVDTSNETTTGAGAGAGGPGLQPVTESVCHLALYKDVCVNSVNTNSHNSLDPRQHIKGAFIGAKNEVQKALEKSETIKAAKDDPRAAEGLEICKEVIGYSMNDLDRVIESIDDINFQTIDDFIEDLRIWTGGAITYLEVCFDAFENSTSDAGERLRKIFFVSREMTSNALNIITGVKTILQTLKIPGIDLSAFGSSRRLLGGSKQLVAGEIPAWVNDPKRRIMDIPLNKIKADAVVPDQHKTITDALKAVPPNNVSPFIIHIKAGVYKEYVEITKKQMNVVLVGDGATKTIITGNKNFADGVQTFKTSTVSALGDGFMARDIGFQNTAGARGHQAVALRVVSDLAIIYNCRMDGFQDTLYAVRGRQFYRDCLITGTIDFIFGDAQAVFQKCEMRIRKPNSGQRCMVTAQGRTEPQGPGAFVLQGCKITGEPDYMPVRTQHAAFLGRPWKEYSRTIVMGSTIDEAIAPAGWTEWQGDFALKTLYYAEYNNKGPGANPGQRVKWPNVKMLSPQEAEGFTPGRLFVTGDRWIPQSGVPYAPGVFNG